MTGEEREAEQRYQNAVLSVQNAEVLYSMAKTPEAQSRAEDEYLAAVTEKQAASVARPRSLWYSESTVKR